MKVDLRTLTKTRMSLFRLFPADAKSEQEKEHEELARSHAEKILVTKCAEAWWQLIPCLRYASRNERVVKAALRKRDASTCRSCLNVLVLNCSRKDGRQPNRAPQKTNRRSILMMSSWCTWMRATLDTKSRQHVFKCIQMRKASRQVNRAAATKLMDHEFRKSSYVHFRAWQHMIRRRRRVLRLCKDLNKRWQLAIMAFKFDWWVAAFMNWMELRESVGNLFQRVTFRLSSHAFLAWSTIVEENHRLLIVGMKSLLRWNQFLLRMSLTGLVVHTKCTNRMMAAFRAVSSRWRFGRLKFCLRILKDNVCQHNKIRNMYVRALVLRSRNVKEKFLLLWWDNVHESHRLTYAITKAKHVNRTGEKISLTTSIVLRNVHRLVSCAMEQWRWRVKWVVRVKTHMELWEKVRRDRLSRDCFGLWLQLSKKSKRQYKLAFLKICKFERTYLFDLLDEWHMIALRNRKHEGWARAKNLKCQRRVGRDMLLLWRSHMHLQRTVSGFSRNSTYLNGLILCRKTFYSWKNSFMKNKRNILSAARALARNNFCNMAFCMDVWRGEMRRIRRMNRLCEQNLLCRNARKVLDAFYLWRAYSTAQKRLVVAAAKVITRRDLACVAGYFYFLAGLMNKWKRISIWCDKMERSTTRWSFFLWCDERARCVQKERKWQYTNTKIFQGLVKRLFYHWQSTHIETTVHTRTVQRMAKRIGAHAVTGPMFNHWQNLIRQRNLLNRTLQLGRLREKPVVLNKYFKLWSERAEYRRMVWSVSRRIKIRWFAMLGTQSFYVWRRYLSSKTNVSALLHHVAIHRHFHFCASFFSVWEEHVRDCTRLHMAGYKAKEDEKSAILSNVQERLLVAETLANSAVAEKKSLSDELALAREECASAYRVIEALNASEKGSKSRIENLVSRLDEATYMYDRLEETQCLVKELQTLRRTSTDEINRLQLEWDVSKAERDSFSNELLETREKLHLAKLELEAVDREKEDLRAQDHDLAAMLSRHINTWQWNLDKVHDDLNATKAVYSRAIALNSSANMMNEQLKYDNVVLNDTLASSKRDNADLEMEITALQAAIATEKCRRRGLILPKDVGNGGMESILLVLDMNFQDIVGKELDFVDEVEAHVSSALGVTEAGWISVTNLQAGSIKACLCFGPGPSSGGLLPVDAANFVQAQAKRKGSVLLSGELGLKIKHVEMPFIQVNGILSNGIEKKGTTSDGDGVIAKAIKSPARVTRKTFSAAATRGAPQLPMSHANKGLPMIQDTHGLMSTVGGTVKVTLRLGLDFRVAGTEGSSQRSLFESNLAQDLSHASGLFPFHFDIRKVSPGSVIVELEINSSPAVPEPLHVAKNLEMQVSDLTSEIYNGATTRYIISFVVEHFPAFFQPPDPAHIEMEKENATNYDLSEKTQQSLNRVSKDSETGYFDSSFASSSMMRESDAIELLANERAMRERIYALECLHSEKDSLIQTLQTQDKSSELLRGDIRELQRLADEKELETSILKSKVEELEAENARIIAETQKRSTDTAARQNSCAALQNGNEHNHGLLPTHRGREMTPDALSFGGPYSPAMPFLVAASHIDIIGQSPPESHDSVPMKQQHEQSSTMVRMGPTVGPGRAPHGATSQGSRADSEQLLQFQSTLRKAEAALAEQSTIVEMQHKAIESAEEQTKVLQEKLQKCQADLAEQREVADAVTAQLEKLSGKNAMLTKENAEHKKCADEDTKRNELLRVELQGSLKFPGQETDKSQASRGDLDLELDLRRKDAADLQREFDELKSQLVQCMEARQKEHEDRVLERKSLEAERKDAVDRQQQVIDRLMKIIDTHRERRMLGALSSRGDEQIEELKLRAAAAENAVQESNLMYQSLQMEMIRQEQETLRLKRALNASMDGIINRSQDLLTGHAALDVMNEVHQLDLNDSAILFRDKTRREYLERAQVGMLKRRKLKVLDKSLSGWIDVVDTKALEKYLFESDRAAHMSDVAAVRTTISSETAPAAVKRHQVAISTRSAPISSPISSPTSKQILTDTSASPPIAPPRHRDSRARTSQGSLSQGASLSPPKLDVTSPILTHQVTYKGILSRLADSSNTMQDAPAAPEAVWPQEPDTLSAQVLKLIGLKLRSDMPPYIVENGDLLIDVFGAVQGELRYSNQLAESGDTLLFVDGEDVSVLGTKGVLRRLQGQAKTQLHLVFSSRRNASLFRITVLRHSHHELL